jgi:preprotein translocase subunit YajC
MFYFMMIRPQKRARQQQVDMLQHLQPGAQVRTTAQIMGTVVEVGDDWAIVETTPGTRIKFGKPAIVGIIMPDEDEEAATPGGIGDAPAEERGTGETGPTGQADVTADPTGQADPTGTAEPHPVQDAVPADAVPAEDAEPAAKP